MYTAEGRTREREREREREAPAAVPKKIPPRETFGNALALVAR